ncbi:MmgE/PrpD family protein [Paraglaciecola sp. 20A4]|uniref:MmgE/PrpD family protein n=1 Tax=Paraglaciecola sp. 20A4 TaxID=2687288 RepID=UPI00140E58FF|nr:MmgE/PrpD family protein [Paraglaciecola sp. 20A4]
MPIKLSLSKQLLIDIDQMPLTQHDCARAGEHVLDWLACASLGKLSDAGRAYQALLSLDEGGKCTAIGGQRVSMQNAAQHNGALGNVLEMDDIHRSSILHPGPVIIPAALAVAEQMDCSLEAFLIAIIKGYEMTIRMGEAIGRSHYSNFHNTATCGTLGAAMAASSILGLTQEQTIWAIGNAGSTTGGLWQMRNEKVLTKQWHNAEACRSGVMAAFMAKQNLTGPEYILEGPQGIFNALSNDASPDKFVEKHASWRMYSCSFKPWPACRHAHGAMDVLLSILQQSTIDFADIERIDVGVYQDAQLFCDRLTPETSLEAKFSIQHALAAILLWGEPQLEHYAQNAFKQAQCCALRERINVYVDQEIEALYPQHFGAKCTVVIKNGQSVVLSQRDTLGDPEKPLTPAQRHNKANMLLSHAGVSNEKITQLCHFDWLQATSISTLSALLRPAPSH